MNIMVGLVILALFNCLNSKTIKSIHENFDQNQYERTTMNNMLVTKKLQNQLLTMVDVYIEQKAKLIEAQRKYKLYKICVPSFRLSKWFCEIHTGDEIDNNLPVKVNKMHYPYSIMEIN